MRRQDWPAVSLRGDFKITTREARTVDGIFGTAWPVEEQQQAQAAPAAAAQDEEPAQSEATWVAVRMVDGDGDPVKGLKFKVELPDGSVKEGALDGDGLAKIQSTKSGDCKVSFPDLDSADWDRA